LENNQIFEKDLLLPKVYKTIGSILLIPGIILYIIRFPLGSSIKFLNIKVFAIYSQYLDSKYFVWLEHNITQELCGILLLTGLVFIAFSREKKENEIIRSLRIRSFILSFYINCSFLIAALLFTYGIAFLEMILFNMTSGLLLYVIIFRYYCIKYRSSIISAS
jgi:hypothetical protein